MNNPDFMLIGQAYRPSERIRTEAGLAILPSVLRAPGSAFIVVAKKRQHHLTSRSAKIGCGREREWMRRGGGLLVFAITLACSATAADAANDGRPDPDLRIDALTTYSTQEAAKNSFRKDAVVWADRYSGFYYERGEPKYGATHDGSYSCRADAVNARYWSTDPRASMEGHPGRNFPFDRLFFGS